MKVKLFSIVTTLILLTSTASAGIVFDPYLGFGSWDQSSKTGASTGSDDGSMNSMGARIGVSIPLFSFGVDYEK